MLPKSVKKEKTDRRPCWRWLPLWACTSRYTAHRFVGRWRSGKILLDIGCTCHQFQNTQRHKLENNKREGIKVLQSGTELLLDKILYEQFKTSGYFGESYIVDVMNKHCTLNAFPVGVPIQTFRK